MSLESADIYVKLADKVLNKQKKPFNAEGFLRHYYL